MKHLIMIALTSVALFGLSKVGAAEDCGSQEAASVYMANGIKIGEVSSNSAIIWIRLTKKPERNINGKPFPQNTNKARKSLRFDNLAEMEGSVPGAVGEVRIAYWPGQDKAKKKLTEWQPVIAEKDFTCQIQITGLFPGAHYSIIVEGRTCGGKDSTVMIEGAFHTAPKVDTPARIAFAVVTGQEYSRRDDKTYGHKIYPVMQKLGLDFFVHTGDIEYYDKEGPYADTIELARFKWNRIYAMPYQRAFHNRTASYFMKDDHDTLKNDCWPGQSYGDLTWEQGLAIFREQVPMGSSTYRTVRWGKDLQVWFVEGRDFRSANTKPDGPDKTIWGAKQKAWFFDTVRKSDATFRNHANKGFKHEGNEIRSFIGKQKNMYVVCGDRHWQYVSVDPVTGVREYSCGPTSMKHAGGFSDKQRSDMHRYLKIVGGFLAVQIERDAGKPVAIFRHYGVDGSVLNEDIVKAENANP